MESTSGPVTMKVLTTNSDWVDEIVELVLVHFPFTFKLFRSR